MQRAPIIVVIVAVVIAATGITALVYSSAVRRDDAPKAAAQTGQVDRPADELSATARQVAGKVPGAETTAKALGTPAGKPNGDNGRSPATGGEVRTPLASSHSRLASEMTPRQRQAVIKARWLRMRKDLKYRLPSTYKLQRLGRAADPDLRLTDHQKEQIDRLNETMKPKIDQALKEIWARRKKVQEDLRAAIVERNDQEIKVNRSRYTRLFGQENKIRQDVLDKEFRAMLRPVLTADQMEILAGGLSDPEQIRRLYGRRPGTTDSVQYQNTKE